MNSKLYYKNVDLQGQSVIVRVDLDVPLTADFKIEDNTRIRKVLLIIEQLLNIQGTKIILISHLGNPNGTIQPELSLKPVADELQRILGDRAKVKFSPDCMNANNDIKVLEVHEILLLENIRFYKEEQDNSMFFGKILSQYGQFYINDDFASVHLKVASVVSITQFFPGKSLYGDNLKNEAQILSQAYQTPSRPFVAVLGGARITEKINIMKNMIKGLDKMIIGGGMSSTFLWSMGKDLGQVSVQPNCQSFCKQLLEQFKHKILLPSDYYATSNQSSTNQSSNEQAVCSIDKIPIRYDPTDIGPISQEQFSSIIRTAKTIVLYGQLQLSQSDIQGSSAQSITQAAIEALKQGATIIVNENEAQSLNSKVRNLSNVIIMSEESMQTYLQGLPFPGIEALTDAPVESEDEENEKEVEIKKHRGRPRKTLDNEFKINQQFDSIDAAEIFLQELQQQENHAIA
ncbi:MAG: Phosphoglycerate kinase [Streblomastix strix]|uniref:Phosphoglycerate kinase n=1 Tax=Streblomastix strix TaxID=222440 RepID=A0A5J4WGI4_9EUKA|nr:MAG: Phosphoglycerate kinase [Streblomastix strix]